MIKELVEQELVKDKKIQILGDTRIHYKKPHKVTLHNTITHLKAVQVNGGISIPHAALSL